MAIAPEKTLITLYNTTDKDLRVLVDGVQLYLPAYTEDTFKKDVAGKFLSEHAGKVRDVDAMGVGVSQSVIEKPKTMWIANMTGDPRLPASIDVKKRRGAIDSIPHPAKKARPVRQEALGGWTERADKYGNLTADRGIAKMWTVPPFQRVEMPEHIGRWFMRRINATAFSYDTVGNEKVLLAKRARAPSDFEPDSKWSLDELRAYMRLLEPTAALPMDEESIRAKLKKSNASETETEFKVRSEARDLLKRLFFLVADAKGPKLPTREEFMLFMHGENVPIEDDIDPDDLLARAEAESDAAMKNLEG